MKRYFQICSLLEELGPVQPRLNKIQKIVQHPDFKYDEKAGPEHMIHIFLASSYWLDQELFDESYLFKKEPKNLLSMQKVHLQMTDIGALLLDKGFPLSYNPEEFAQAGKDQLAPYVKTFSEQCHKRRNFLHNQSAFSLPRVRATFSKERR